MAEVVDYCDYERGVVLRVSLVLPSFCSSLGGWMLLCYDGGGIGGGGDGEKALTGDG